MRSGWSQGQGPRGTRISHTRDRTQSRGACHRAWNAYDRQQGKGRSRTFTALLHHVTIDALREAYPGAQAPCRAGSGRRDVGGLRVRVGGQPPRPARTEVHRGAYRALPVRRRFIPKPDGRQRPLGIAALEDKIVQRAVAAVLNAIYEEDFLGFSYGFRPGETVSTTRSTPCAWRSRRKRVNWILDADIRASSTQSTRNGWCASSRHRVGDERIVRLVSKWLKAGVLEEGSWRRQ